MTVAPKQVTSASVSEILAEWAAALDEESLPANVRRAVADTVLDTVALSIASVDTDYGQAVLAAADVPEEQP